MKVIGFIYLITNMVNQKIYIGLTTRTIEGRWKEHVRRSRCINRYLYSAIRKYGYNSFKIEKIKTCFSLSQLYDSEVFFIERMKSQNRKIGYNNSKGGENSSVGKTVSVETRIKISKAQKGVKKSVESKLKGTKKTDMVKMNMSIAMYKRMSYPENREKISKAFSKPIKFISNNGDVKIYSSITKASIDLNIGAASIGRYCNGKRKSKIGSFILLKKI